MYVGHSKTGPWCHNSADNREAVVHWVVACHITVLEVVSRLKDRGGGKVG